MRVSHIVHAAGHVGGPAMLMRSEDKAAQEFGIGIAANKIRVLAKPQGGKRAFAIGVNVHRLDF